jgi:hypothetical protein
MIKVDDGLFDGAKDVGLKGLLRLTGRIWEPSSTDMVRHQGTDLDAERPRVAVKFSRQSGHPDTGMNLMDDHESPGKPFDITKE